MKDNVAIAKTGLTDAKDAKAALLADADATGAEAMRRAQMLGEYMVKSAGPQAAVYQARLDALKLKQEMNMYQASSLQHLTKTITAKHESENIARSGQPVKPSGIPTHVADELTNSDLPVDATGTNPRQHTTAAGKLAPLNTFLDTAGKLIQEAEANGPARNSTISGVLNTGTTQAEREAAVTRMHSAYAAIKGESVGEGNAKQLERAMPSPPSSLAPEGQWKAWLAKTKEVYAEVRQLRNENLANAGVPRDQIKAADAKIDQRHGAAAAPASHAPAATHVRTATNPQTREKLKFDGGKWVPL